jgi:formylglycine-generating enzyme required for sulfatase activity
VRRPAALPPHILKLLKDDDAELRLMAVQKLERLLTDTSESLRLAARQALEELKDKDDSRKVWGAATDALGRAEREPDSVVAQPAADPAAHSQSAPPPQAQATPALMRSSGPLTAAMPRRVLLVLGGLVVLTVAIVLMLAKQKAVMPATETPASTSASAPHSGSLEQEGSAGAASCPACPVMVSIAAGDFMMGTPRAEKGRYDDESPQHKVHISAFEVAKYPVTRGQWRLYANETGQATKKDCDWLNPGFPQHDTHPVVCVSWQEAQDYIVWLNGKSGQHFRLLTEAEYEYVNRAGTQTAYFWGDSEADLAQYASMNGEGTTPVGSFAANDWGLFDTTGNVWSWTQDCWHTDYHGAPPDGSAWETGCSSSARVLRGGSWTAFTPWALRSACRNHLDNGFWNDGFRLARTL